MRDENRQQMKSPSGFSRRNLLGFAGLGALMLPLSGCVTVLPKSDPIQLYSFRFKSDLAAMTLAESVTPARIISLGPVIFNSEAGGDRIISRENNELAYIGGARWSVPATDLFTQALTDGFSRLGKTVRLETRSGLNALLRLDLNVSRFEVEYIKRRPTIKIAMIAHLVQIKDRISVASLPLQYDYAVSKNKASDIVAAFEQGVSELIGRLVDFCEKHDA